MIAPADIHALIIGAWLQDVHADYVAGRVFSEYELQSILYAALRRDLDPHGLRIMAEPSLDRGRWRPDILIAQPAQLDAKAFKALAVIELKLDRGGFIRFAGEFDRLAERAGRTFEIAEQRPMEDGRSMAVSFDDDTRCYLAFVGEGADESGGGGCKALYARDMMATDAGRHLVAVAPGVARRTTLLYGRVSRREVEFGEEPLLV
jgi:hypothetical protein